MALTWAQFKSGVLSEYNPGTAAGGSMGYTCVAAYVKALIVREVDGDLLLSKSYMNTFNELKAKLAGGVVAGNFATIKAEVQSRITVDASRAAISGLIDKLIQEGADDLSAMKTTWEQYLVDAVVDIQRHVPCFTLNQQNLYLKADVTNQGFIAKITPPAGSYAHRVTYERYAPDLTAGVNYTAGTYVLSNMRIYTVVVGGVMGVVGTGLQTFDGSDETLGGLTFSWYSSFSSKDCVPVSWDDRLDLLNSSQVGGGPYFSVSPWNDELWVWPMLDSTNFRIRINWNGIKTTFADGDTITLNETCYAAASEYVRALVQKNLSLDQQLTAGSLAAYQRHLRNLWLDCQDKSNSR
jgi:hypothetical protein